MKRIVGQCSKCGEAAHPKGNVFRIVNAFMHQMDTGEAHGPVDADGLASFDHPLKVCNNCNTAHPFRCRTSAKAKRLQATADRLMAKCGA